MCKKKKIARLEYYYHAFGTLESYNFLHALILVVRSTDYVFHFDLFNLLTFTNTHTPAVTHVHIVFVYPRTLW